MICGLCQKDVPKLPKSHVIAKAIMMRDRPRGFQGPMIILPSRKGQRIQRSQTGLFSQIVCASCEKSFQTGDDALLWLCRNLATGIAFGHDGQRPHGVAYPDADITGVHRGVLTTLFRAHLSPLSLFKHVVLEPIHEQCIRELLLSDAPTLGSDYSVLLRVVASKEGLTMPSPFRETLDGVEVIRIYFPSLTAYIKVDERPFGPLFQSIMLGATPELRAVLKEQLSPSELEFHEHLTDGCDAEIARYTPKPKNA